MWLTYKENKGLIIVPSPLNKAVSPKSMKYLISIIIVMFSLSGYAEPTKDERQKLANEFLDKGFAAYQAGNYKASAEFYIASMQQWPIASAAANLCNLYLYGQGVARDFSKAYTLCSMAAKYNNLNALTMLGEMHMNGKGVPVNEDIAINFYRKAAEGGHTQGQYVLGLLLIEKSPSEAKSYLEMAANNGHVQATEYLKMLK
jgi:TPR repeat protein